MGRGERVKGGRECEGWRVERVERVKRNDKKLTKVGK
jgi:hypothetical protein